MKIQRFDWDGGDPRALASEIRGLQPALGEVSADVAKVVAAVEAEGDPAVERFEQSFGGVVAKPLRVPDDELRSAPEEIPDDVRDALGNAIANVRSVAEDESPKPRAMERGGAAIAYREVSVAAAGAYVPGGGAAYPSTAMMCCVPAQVAEVERIAVATPPDADGKVNPLVLAAAALAGATEVYAMGGAQAIAALGLGTETVAPVDVIVGPGNRYVQEAKRQLVGRVGIDGIAGPSELMVLVDGSAELPWIALDLCAQAEHADDGLLIACSAHAGVLAELEEEVQKVAGNRDTVQEAPLAMVTVPSADAAMELANAIAPEHLELACDGAQVLARMALYPGCVFIGPGGGTAFGDFAAGTNHVLPTGGAGRFQGPLGPDAFRRRTPTVRISEEAARELAPTVATLARAEGFPVHAESAEVRAEDGGER